MKGTKNSIKAFPLTKKLLFFFTKRKDRMSLEQKNPG